MKNDTFRKRERLSNSKFYAKSREVAKIACGRLNKKNKQLSHRLIRKALKEDLKDEVSNLKEE